MADKREEWFQGKTLTGCANDLHGPYLGPDGYIYWTKGAFAEQTHKLGNGRTLNDKAAHIFRARPDGAAIHTFNDRKEEDLLTTGLANYSKTAPRLDRMVKYALDFLSAKGQFFLVAEEEGTDNFGNKNNANGKLEALLNTDNAIGEVLKFYETNPNTMLIIAADSDAGGLGIAGAEVKGLEVNSPLPPNDYNGAPIDGVNGTGTLPFISKPDKTGRTFPFGIVWSSNGDLTGPIVARAHGLNADKMHSKIDNTYIFRMMYLTLFGVWLGCALCGYHADLG